tara:strand:- start:4295 stop:5188 length:894 start_codon:yes stop_codon:yes gene_type:complete
MSTYTQNSGIELIGTGERSGTWGTATNVNLQIIDRLTTGVGAITLSGTTHPLSVSDGTLSDGHYKVLVLGGSPSGDNTITLTPNDAQHLYFVKNGSGQNAIFQQGDGTGGTVTVANGKSAIIYSDGAGSGAQIVDLTSILAITLTQMGVTADAAELNYNDITTLGTSEAEKVVTADANGVVTFDDGISEKYTAVTSSSNATTVNLRDGTNFSHTLTEATTFTFSNPAAADLVSSFTIKIVQDASASSFGVTWPAAVDWPDKTEPTITTTANAVDIFVFFTHDAGTTWYGFLAGADMG